MMFQRKMQKQRMELWMLASLGYDVPSQQEVQIYACDCLYHEEKSYVLAKGLGRK